MHDSKLIETLKILTKDEINAIRNLLSSDWIIKGIPQKEAMQLLEYILQYEEDWENENLSKDIVFPILFAEKQINFNKLAKVMTSLMGVIEYYISYHIEESEFEELKINLNLANFYKNRGLNPRSDIFSKRSEEYFKEEKGLSIQYEKYLGKYLEDCLLNPDYQKKEKIAIASVIFQYKVVELLRSLELLCNIIYPRFEWDEENEQLFNDITQQLVQNPNFEDNKLIKINYLALLMSKNINEGTNKYYKAYKDLLLSIENKLADKTAKILFSYERSFLIKLYNNQPNETSVKLLMTMYKEQLQKGYLLINGILPKGIVLNLVSIAIKTNDSDFIYELVIHWGDKIGKLNEREDIVSFCWANYYFLTKDFDKANEYIKISYLNIDFIINTRRMRVKILYEQKESITLTYELDAFKVFVFRQYKKGTLSENKYQLNNNFVGLLMQIIALEGSGDKPKVGRIKEKITKSKCTDKEWLLEKINLIKV
jgi:hypothetical protein